jgi:flavin reductase (DIM6/NTAB) family NADH-FMN oxidoreductase RutF
VGTKRYSRRLLEDTPEFVINIPSAELLRSVWICGTKSGRDVDKFEEAGLTRAPAEEVSVPLIAECMGWLECRVKDRIELGDHVLFVGEILHASVRDEAFDHLYRLGPSGRTLHHLGESSFALSGNLVDAREGRAP